MSAECQICRINPRNPRFLGLRARRVTPRSRFSDRFSLDQDAVRYAMSAANGRDIVAFEESTPGLTAPMANEDKKRPHGDTLPLFGRKSVPPIAPDPRQIGLAFAPDQARLDELHDRLLPAVTDPPTSKTPSSRIIRDSLPPSAPDWMRGARTLSRALEAIVAKGEATPLEQAAIARMLASWSLGGLTENQILHVAHLVARGHRAIRETRRHEPEAAIRDCAGVIHTGLPSALRKRVPVERVQFIVRALRDTADPWVGVVEATCELVGWKDLARWHAAALLRYLLEGAEPGKLR
jgi:hypothetical protein